MNRFKTLMAAVLVGAAGAALAHGDQAHRKDDAPVKMEQKEWGIAGQRAAVTRTIEISMTDKMRFSPDRFEVKQGDTVRLVVKNAGKVMHELVIGTRKELDEHGAMMMKFPGMEHDEPYMTHVAPGKTGEVIWTFNRAGDFDFACLIPGHYQAGMVGKIKVSPGDAKEVADGSARKH